MMLRRRSWHEFPKLWEFSQETAYGERLSFYGRPMCFSSLKRSLSRELPFNNRYNQQKLMHSKKQHTHTQSKVQPFIFENTPFTAATRCQWNGGKQLDRTMNSFYSTSLQFQRSVGRRSVGNNCDSNGPSGKIDTNQTCGILSYKLCCIYKVQPWAPKTMKNKGFGQLKTRLFTMKISKNVGLRGPAYYMLHHGFLFPLFRTFRGSKFLKQVPISPHFVEPV